MSLASVHPDPQGRGTPALPLGYDWLAANAHERNLFFEPALLEPALRHLATPGVRLCVAADGESGIAAAAAPLLRLAGRYGPVPTPVPLGVWCHPYAMVASPLIAPEAPQAALDALLKRAARHDDGPAVLLIENLPMDGPLWPLLQALTQESGRRMQVMQTRPRAGLRLGADAVAQATARTLFGKKSSQSIRTGRRKLQAIGTLSHTVARTPQDVAAALDDLLTLEAAGWKGRRGTALKSIGHDGFAMEAVARLAQERRARVDLTCLARPGEAPRAIAGTLTLRAGSDEAPLWMPWKTAYDEAYAPCGAGALTLADLTTLLLADAQAAGAPLLLDSLAAPHSILAARLWRDRWTLADLLIDLNPGAGTAFGTILLAEKARRSTLAAGRAARDAIVLAARRAQQAMRGSPKP